MYSWKDKESILIKLVENVSLENGGDDSVWLKGYIEELVIKYASDLEVAIECFKALSSREAICTSGSQRKAIGGLIMSSTGNKLS